MHYTIGQRRGLNIGGGIDGKGVDTQPLYVLALDAENNTVIVGPKESLAKNKIYLKETNWLGQDIPSEGIKCSVKIRSVSSPVNARFHKENDTYFIITDQDQFGVAGGQACVVYDNERVLGGGWITHADYIDDTCIAA